VRAPRAEITQRSFMLSTSAASASGPTRTRCSDLRRLSSVTTNAFMKPSDLRLATSSTASSRLVNLPASAKSLSESAGDKRCSDLCGGEAG
jgi:hypothetical protein